MRKLFLLIITVFAVLFSYSQESNSLLWKIEGNGLEKPSYLYGTIHVICPDDFNMEESIKKAFKRTEQVYLEIDFDNPGIMAEMQKVIVLGDGKTAADFLNKEDYDTLNNFLMSELGMGLETAGKLKPFTLMSLMVVPIIGCQPKSFETEFVQMASYWGMEVSGLETATYQMSLFDSIPYEKQYKMLLEMVNKKDSVTNEFKEIVDLYKQKDIEKLGKMLNESEWEFVGYEGLLIFNRNQNWIPIIENAVSEKPTFIAVGAGHLPGENGLISLLRNKGFTVTPVL
ncbi:MAG: TraB/GumN family protein [Prolixibacteraceae bacterium]|nr:TraB/GumN family protein [Prolixibacteraceae bacterium]